MPVKFLTKPRLSTSPEEPSPEPEKAGRSRKVPEPEHHSTERTLHARTRFLLKTRQCRTKVAAELVAFLSIYHPDWPSDQVKAIKRGEEQVPTVKIVGYGHF